MGYNRQSQIKLSQLQMLIAVANHGSFSEAALQMQMSQSAISHAISTLEEDLGVSLFSRGRYGAISDSGGRTNRRSRPTSSLWQCFSLRQD